MSIHLIRYIANDDFSQYINDVAWNCQPAFAKIRPGGFFSIALRRFKVFDLLS